jgi:hypothetical protein
VKHPTDIMGVCHSEYHWHICRFGTNRLIVERRDMYHTRTLAEMTQHEYANYRICKDHTLKIYPQPRNHRWKELGDCLFELPSENTKLSRVYISSIDGILSYAQKCNCPMGYIG